MALRGAGKRAISHALSGKYTGAPCLLDFRHGNLKGKRESRMPTTGQLSATFRLLLQQDLDKFGCLYVVYSYKTPIAWYPLPHPNQGLDNECKWTMPPVKYSVTTTQHQNVVAVEIANPGFYRNVEW
ncbi:MAG TPA: hypothetical protein VIY48_14165 [Candidatus Paceibacterota bacterium]